MHLQRVNACEIHKLRPFSKHFLHIYHFVVKRDGVSSSAATINQSNKASKRHHKLHAVMSYVIGHEVVNQLLIIITFDIKKKLSQDIT